MNTRDQLRLNGFSVTQDGKIDCCGAGIPHPFDALQPHLRPRFEQEHCAVVKIDGPKELVEQLISAADSPRALTGRNRGGAVLLFRRERGQEIKLPNDPKFRGLDVFDLMQTSTGERVTITIKSEGMTLDVGSYSWQKSRSPLETTRDSLPILTQDLSEIVMHAAFASCVVPPTEEEIRKETEFAERRAAYERGELKFESDEERQAREDEITVRENEGKEFSPWDFNEGRD